MPQHRQVTVNGISMHIAEQGEGPLVLLLHGFPESWYSWRHQFQPLADAGYRVVAPDQRGYGGTDQPSDIADYSIFHLVGDVVGLIEALGEQEAVVVGHDWGAPVAWNTAMMRPDLIRGVAGLSVAPTPRGTVAPLVSARERFGDGFYQIYFQQPGVADAELNADVRGSFRKTLAATSGESAGAAAAPTSVGGGFLAGMPEPEQLPSWLTEADIDAYTEQYQRNGFTGGLNWYRNIDRNWALTLPWQNARITPPALYITGDKDLVRGFYPPGYLEQQLPQLVTDLRKVVDLPGCGHWTQQERPEEVNAALLEFLAGL